MDGSDVAAREAIRALVVRYNRLADQGRFDETLELFDPSATMETPFGVYRGADEIRAIFSQAVSDGASGAEAQTVPLSGRPHVRHHLATHDIELVDEGSARGRCYYSVFTQVGLDHWGFYDDEYVRADESSTAEGPWRFRSRRVRVDGQSPHSLFPPSR